MIRFFRQFRGGLSAVGLPARATSLAVGQSAAAEEKGDVGKIGDRKVAHRGLISQENEIALGRQYALETDKSARLVTDPLLFKYANRIAQSLARNSDLSIPLNLRLIGAPEIGAFTLPRGFPFANSDEKPPVLLRRG